MSRRLHYIDWLRVLAVLLLFPFHTLRVYNVGEPFYVKGPELSIAASYVLGFIDTWHMPLLFLLAGASTYFALGKRSGRQYLSERMTRLLVPLTFGILVLIPPQTWYGARFNSGYTGTYVEYLTSGAFLQWNVQGGGDYYGGFGIGQLWFILWLFLISLIVLPLLLWGRGERGAAAMQRVSRFFAHPAAWLVAAFAILLGEALPDFAGKNLFYYLVFFVFGYIAMCAPEFMTAAERFKWPALALGAPLCVWWVASGPLRDSLPDPSLLLTGIVLLGMLGRWLVIVGLLGVGRRYLDTPSPQLSYLAEASYPLYILHQTVIVVIAFYLVQLPMDWFAQWLLLLGVATAGTFVLYEGVRRIGWLRFLFGMRPAKRDAKARA